MRPVRVDDVLFVVTFFAIGVVRGLCSHDVLHGVIQASRDAATSHRDALGMGLRIGLAFTVTGGR